MKVTPPERSVLRYMSRARWMTANQIADGAKYPRHRIGGKLNRLRSLGLVEHGPDGWRRTSAGHKWVEENLLSA